ncbi:unnamed protein product [Chironomus riparius]|uniref:Uncharacterized protein n=1 Tax=Chironomus riparius TaxID=315576 RepID=A0A9N9RW66_9DIPT|nr:unnamed protein product [Chironomus riparius]
MVSQTPSNSDPLNPTKTLLTPTLSPPQLTPTLSAPIESLASQNIPDTPIASIPT